MRSDSMEAFRSPITIVITPGYRKIAVQQNSSKLLARSRVLRTCIFPITTYGCETLVLRKLDIKRINAFEMKCYRKILRIPWIRRQLFDSTLNSSTNELAVSFCKTLKTEILWPRYSPQWSRTLEETVMPGMVAGKRNRVKPRQRWGGGETSHIRLARWRQQAQRRRTGINSQRHLGSDVPTRICFEEKKKFVQNGIDYDELARGPPLTLYSLLSPFHVSRPKLF